MMAFGDTMGKFTRAIAGVIWAVIWAVATLSPTALAQNLPGEAAQPGEIVSEEAPPLREAGDVDAQFDAGRREESTWLRGDRATLRGLDKVTAQTRDFEVSLGEPVQFGALTILMATACAKRPPEKTPETWVGLEISDPELDNRGRQRGLKTVYRGWMLAQSPGLSPLDHQVYDVWPLECHASDFAGSRFGGSADDGAGTTPAPSPADPSGLRQGG